MTDSFDAVAYASFLRGKWRVIGLACASALLLATLVTLVKSKQFTATSRILIELPGGNDPRTPLAISAVYLDSLKTYEQMVTSDTTFQRALDKFHLRSLQPARSLESWKSSILKVSVMRNTRILEISVTLDNPATAQAMAQFLAEDAVTMNRTLIVDAGKEALDEGRKQLERAQQDLEQAGADMLKLEPVEPLDTEVQSLDIQRTRVRRDLLDAELTTAGAVTDKRVDYLRGQLATLDSRIAAQTALLAARSGRLHQGEERRKSAQTAYDNARRALQDIQAGMGLRGERLRLIDPGVVPERPSSPNLPLNLIAAFLFSLAASLGWITLQFAMRSPQPSTFWPVRNKAADD